MGAVREGKAEASADRMWFYAESLTCNLLFGGLSVLAVARRFTYFSGYLAEAALYALQLLLVAFLWRQTSGEKGRSSAALSVRALYGLSAALGAVSMRQSVLANAAPHYMVLELLVVPVVLLATSVWHRPGLSELLPCALIVAGEFVVFEHSSPSRAGLMAAAAELCFLAAQQLVLMELRMRAEEEGEKFDPISFHASTAPLQAAFLVVLSGGYAAVLEGSAWLAGDHTRLELTSHQIESSFNFLFAVSLKWAVLILLPSSILIAAVLYFSTQSSPLPELATTGGDGAQPTKRVCNITLLFRAILLARFMIFLPPTVIPNALLVPEELQSASQVVMFGLLVAFFGGVWHSALSHRSFESSQTVECKSGRGGSELAALGGRLVVHSTSEDLHIPLLSAASPQL